MRYVTRQEWGARPPRSIDPMTGSLGLVVHDVGVGKPLSSAVRNGEPEAVARQLRNMQSFHMDTNYLVRGGASDIAYSFIISQGAEPAVYEGRGWGRAGGHTAGANDDDDRYGPHHGVLMLIGDGATEQATPAALEAFRWLLEEHRRRYDSDRVLGHREVGSNPTGTSCPGTALLRQVHAGDFSCPPTPPTRRRTKMLLMLRNEDGRLEEFRCDDRGRVLCRWQTAPNNGWSDWVELVTNAPGAFDTLAGARNADGRLEVVAFHSAYGVEFRTWQTAPGEGPWVPWQRA